ncbi:SpoVR family protein [Clostridium sp. JS66]|uniref:SpoVR family protein n=1 Tax=Clostridium sp. JS66 TaxID=3064705 RepID=UPI00298E95DD|nr:SpoVR family protein [Clostridium sp. JS66]
MNIIININFICIANHIEFIKRHNDVITPSMGRINPYHLGFEMFKFIENKYGID